MQENVKSEIYIHGIVTNGGAAINIVLKKVSEQFYVSILKRHYLNTLYERV